MKIIFSVLFFIIATSFATANTITICKTGCDYNIIQTAVDSSKSGDTLLIKAGIYKESNIIIYKKSLHIIGEEGTTIDTHNNGYGFSVEATDITVENAFFGFLIQKSKDGLVHNNTISGKGKAEADSGNAIHLWHCENVNITNNDVRRMRDGIYLEFGSNAYISNNYSTENMRYGLHFMFSNNNTYENNVFEANGAGVAVMFSKKIKMYNNIFKKNWGTASYGILLKEINDAEL
jgi:nitrous oxidase accessory protein